MDKLNQIEQEMSNAIACEDFDKYLLLKKDYDILRLKEEAKRDRERHLKDFYAPERSIPTFMNGKLVKE